MTASQVGMGKGVKRQVDREGQFHSILQQRFLHCGFSLSLLPIPPTTHPSLPPPYQRPSFLFLRKMVSYFSVNSFCFPQNKTIQPSTSHGSLNFKERTAPVCDTWGKKLGECGQNRNSGIRPRSGVYFSHLASLIWISNFTCRKAQCKLSEPPGSAPTIASTSKLTLGLLDAIDPRALLRLQPSEQKRFGRERKWALSTGQYKNRSRTQVGF